MYMYVCMYVCMYVYIYIYIYIYIRIYTLYHRSPFSIVVRTRPKLGEARAEDAIINVCPYLVSAQHFPIRLVDVYIYIYMSIYIPVSLYKHMNTMCTYLYVSTYLYIVSTRYIVYSIYIHMYIYIYIHIHLSLSLPPYIYIYDSHRALRLVDSGSIPPVPGQRRLGATTCLTLLV